MSDPKTPVEEMQAEATRWAAGPAENLVSTACPKCEVRFAMLATWRRGMDEVPDWFLRCTNCGWHGRGNLKARGDWKQQPHD